MQFPFFTLFGMISYRCNILLLFYGVKQGVDNFVLSFRSTLQKVKCFTYMHANILQVNIAQCNFNRYANNSKLLFMAQIKMEIKEFNRIFFT